MENTKVYSTVLVKNKWEKVIQFSFDFAPHLFFYKLEWWLYKKWFDDRCDDTLTDKVMYRKSKGSGCLFEIHLFTEFSHILVHGNWIWNAEKTT